MVNKSHPPIIEMANEIFNKKLFNTTSGKIRSDAFVNLGYLVTMKEQNKVQNIVNNKLEIKKVNPVYKFIIKDIFSSQITISNPKAKKNSNKPSNKLKRKTQTRLKSFTVLNTLKSCIILEIAKRQQRARWARSFLVGRRNRKVVTKTSWSYEFGLRGPNSTLLTVIDHMITSVYCLTTRFPKALFWMRTLVLNETGC